MRADREIDLDKSWTNDYDPVERWWGVEVEFPPQLDEVFGVTNNKQSATHFTEMAHFDWKSEAEPGESFAEMKARLEEEADPRLPLIDLVYYLREKLLPYLRKELKGQTEGTRGSGKKRHEDATSKADDVVKRRSDEGHKGLTDDLAAETSQEKSEQEQLDNLVQKHGLTREDAERTIHESTQRHRKVRLVTSFQQENPGFFGVEFFPDLLQVSLNMDHPVHEKLIAVLESSKDEGESDLRARLQSAEEAFLILLYAWARFEDEQPTRDRNRLRQMRWDWGTLARNFLEPDLDDE